MGLFSFKKKETQDVALEDRTDYPDGPIAGRFFAGVDRAAAVQEPAIRAYVEKIAGKGSNLTLEQRQARVDKHFRNLATGTGLGTGGLAAMPGIGTLMSLAGITGESFLLLEACGFYALASAELQGVDISDEQHRRMLILAAVSGASSNDLVKALTEEGTLTSVRSLRGLTKASGKELVTINSTLGRIAFRQMRRKFRGALLKKLLPFGLGAFLGARANRKIADNMITQVHRVVGELKAVSVA